MLYRNLGAIEVEETLRLHPIDGVVLMGGCDKSTPALIMGAVSMGLPFIYLPAGAMLRGNYAGEKLGSANTNSNPLIQNAGIFSRSLRCMRRERST